MRILLVVFLACCGPCLAVWGCLGVGGVVGGERSGSVLVRGRNRVGCGRGGAVPLRRAWRGTGRLGGSAGVGDGEQCSGAGVLFGQPQ